MRKATPGPWFTFSNDHCVGGPYHSTAVPDRKTAGIAMCNLHLRTDDENKANARLIATTPDLLAVCKAVIDAAVTESGHCAICLVSLPKHASGCVVLAVQAAITKAEPQS